MNIVDAVKDENLLKPFLAGADGSLQSWRRWLTALKAVYGLPIPARRHDLITQCTGRDAAELPRDGFHTALFLTGRRSGKSRIAAVIGAFEAALAGHEAKLAKGEKGVVAICAPTKAQARVVKDYLRAIFETPLLHAEVTRETAGGFELRSGTRIEILAGDFRTIRGYTLIAAIVDEAAFFGYDAESKVKSDTELVRAIKPSLATIGGKLIAISSPYARKGWCFETHKRHFGNDAGTVLVFNCASRVLNPTLSQSIVDEALAEDLQAAKSEYLGEFRDDIAEFLPRAVIEAVVVEGRRDLLPHSQYHYFAFADLSGGRSDDATLAIAHRERRTVIVDCVRRYKPPFSPHDVIVQMAEVLKQYKLRVVVGDNYGAEFVARAFQSCGIRYRKCEKPKAQLYAELLPRICSREIELPQSKQLVDQLAALERRVRAGGRDIIDHPLNGKDDLANAIAGVATIAGVNLLRIGAF